MIELIIFVLGIALMLLGLDVGFLAKNCAFLYTAVVLVGLGFFFLYLGLIIKLRKRGMATKALILIVLFGLPVLFGVTYGIIVAILFSFSFTFNYYFNALLLTLAWIVAFSLVYVFAGK